MQYHETYSSRRKRLKYLAKIKFHRRMLASFGACLIPALVTWGLRLFPSDIAVVNFVLLDQFVISVSLLMAIISVAASVLVAAPLDAGLAGYFMRLLTNAQNPPSALSVCDCFGPGYLRLVRGMFAYRALSLLPYVIPLLAALLPGMLSREMIEGYEVYRASGLMYPLLLVAVALNLYIDTTLSMTPYLLISDPGLSAREAMKGSFEITRGHVFELLIMDLSFLPWYWVIMMTLFIGTVYVYPYIQTTYAAYYLELSGARWRVQDEAARAD